MCGGPRGLLLLLLLLLLQLLSAMLGVLMQG
jgi:hypothetical protein